MGYRPIMDSWALARPKVSYYGAYPNGFLERARVFLPVTRDEPVLHVCGGQAKQYPTWSTLCPNDLTIDIDDELVPDLVWNVRTQGVPSSARFTSPHLPSAWCGGWRGMIADPPYSEDDAEHYRLGKGELPPLRKLVSDCLDALVVGGRVGILHYRWARPLVLKHAKSIAKCNVTCGFDNRDRCYSVWEKL